MYRRWIAIGMWATFLSPAVAVELDLVALTGQQAAGADVGVLYDSFDSPYSHPRINGAGQVLFPATLAGLGISEDNDGGLWVADTASSSVALMGRQGSQASGAPDGVVFGPDAFVRRPQFDEHFGQFVHAFNDAGQFVYWASLAGPGVDAANDSGLWTGMSAADTALLARAGDQAAGMPAGVVYANLVRDVPVINPNGQIVVSGRITGPGVISTLNEDVLWTGTPADLTVVARQGNPAPDTTETFALHMYKGFEALINSAGELQVKSALSSNGVWTVDGDNALWTGNNGASLDLFVRENEPAPGLGPGVVLTSNFFLRPTASTGKSVFAAGLSGPGVTVANRGTIWTDTTTGDPSLVVRRGDPGFPGTESNLTFELFGTPVMNELGTFIFRTQWDHVDTDFPYVAGIHMGSSANDLELIVGGDQPIPGLDADLRISSVGGLAINGAGEFMFSASIKDSDPLSRINLGKGIWGYDPIRGTELIVQTGDQLEVAPDDWRTVRFLRHGGGSSLDDGTFRGLTDDGQFVFMAIFTDGSEGIYIGNVGVPEPGSLTLAIWGSLACLCRQRQMPLRRVDVRAGRHTGGSREQRPARRRFTRCDP